jgi:hypothetical protein
LSARFQQQNIKNNTTGSVFHELGHVLERGNTQDRVIHYENNARRQFGPTMRHIIKPLKRDSMVTKMFKLILVAQLIFVIQSAAQTDWYCENVEAIKIESKGEFLPDSLYAACSENDKGVVLRIVNTTDKPVYLFSSYFSEIFHSSS